MNKPLCLVLALLTGCSFAFTHGPPEAPRTYPDCTTSFTWPVIDGVFAVIFLAALASAIAMDGDVMAGDQDDKASRGENIASAAILATATGAGAIVGSRRVARCRRARETFTQQRPYDTGGTPYGYGDRPSYVPAPAPPPPAPAPAPAPPSTGLGTEGDSCTASTECATGLRCQGDVCIRPPPAT